jgi:hypothetical protein
VLMATGNGEGCPLTVGFSNNALPPPSDFISRSAISVISVRWRRVGKCV